MRSDCHFERQSRGKDLTAGFYLLCQVGRCGFYHVALRPQKRGCLLGTGTGVWAGVGVGGGGERTRE